MNSSGDVKISNSKPQCPALSVTS